MLMLQTQAIGFCQMRHVTSCLYARDHLNRIYEIWNVLLQAMYEMHEMSVN
jgi:hypothetical protein